MKKYFILSFLCILGFSGCAQLDQVGNSIGNTIGNIKSLFTPLGGKEFCEIKNQSLELAKERYSGRTYIFTGKIIAIKQSGGYTTIGIIDEDKSYLYAKVSNYNHQRKGETIGLIGKISPSNFNKNFKNKCYILMDEARIQ